MSDQHQKVDAARPLTGLQAALADIAERRRRWPGWSPGMDPTYAGLRPDVLEKMTEADYADYVDRREKERRWLKGEDRPAENASPPQPVIRACLPFGQRVRELRRAARWTQSEIAWQLGVSRRSIIRYEQGRSAPLRAATLLAMRRLEMAFSQQLDAKAFRLAK